MILAVFLKESVLWETELVLERPESRGRKPFEVQASALSIARSPWAPAGLVCLPERK